MNIKGIAIAAALVASLGLAGCTTQVASQPTTHASAAAQPSAAAKPASNVHGFGDVITYKDGVSISVSAPTPFTPSTYAAGVTPGATNELFTVVVTNGSKTQFTPYTSITMNSAGASASSITDVGSPIGDVGVGTSTVLLPGQTIKWLMGFSVPDPTNMTMDAELGVGTYEAAIFTNTK